MSTVIPGAKQTIFQEDVAYKRAVSENLLTKIGSAINYLGDALFIKEDFEYAGPLNSSHTYSVGGAGMRFFERDVSISSWFMTVGFTGTSGTTSFNFAIYNNDGNLIGDLFSTPPSIAGGNRARVGVGKNQATATDLSFNPGAVTINNGTLAFTTLDAGWAIVPRLSGSAGGANNLLMSLKLRPI